MIEDICGATAARARELPERVLHEQVDGEWSFVPTHRHLAVAMDCGLRRMVRGSPARTTRGAWEGRGSRDLAAAPRPGRRPSLDQVLSLSRERMDEVCEVIGGANPNELERDCIPPDSPGHPRKDHTVLQCLHVVLKEE